MRDVHARRPILWLNEESLADRGTADFLVGVSVENQIDSGNFSRDSRCHILTWHSSRDSIVARRLVETRVYGYPYDFPSSPPCCLPGLPYRRHYITEPKASLDVLGVPQRHAGSRRADHSNLDSRSIDDRPPVVRVNVGWIEPVGVR